MEFRDFLHSIGLMPRDIDAGKWQRCPTTNHPRKKNGSYKLALDGRIGWAMDYAIHSEPIVWRPEGEVVIKIDHAEIARRRAEEHAAERRAICAAQACYKGSMPLTGGHPYLDGKGLRTDGCGGLRIDSKGWLVIPMLRDGEIISVQRISPDGEKKFWPGAPVGGAVYHIGKAGLLDVLCEGFATGLTIYQSIRNCRVIVAFNAGNLVKASSLLEGLAVVAADNDHETMRRIGINPGIDKATEAADKRGIRIAYPECSGSDWDDYRQQRIEEITERESLKSRGMDDRRIRQMVFAEISMQIKREASRAR